VRLGRKEWEVELGLVLVMLTRRLVVDQRRIHLVQEMPQVLALALASIDVDRSFPAFVLAVPADPCRPKPHFSEAQTLSSDWQY
jgi:hypothetical protein